MTQALHPPVFEFQPAPLLCDLREASQPSPKIRTVILYWVNYLLQCDRNFKCLRAVCVPSVMPSSATPWTVTLQGPLSIGFFRQEYWSGLPFPAPGDLPNPQTKAVNPAFAGRYFYHRTTWEAHRAEYLINVRPSTISNLIIWLHISCLNIWYLNCWRVPADFGTSWSFWVSVKCR